MSKTGHDIKGLQHLLRLRKEGVISDEEFQQKRTESLELPLAACDRRNGSRQTRPKFKLSDLTSCQRKNQRKRRRLITEQKQILAKSIHAKRLQLGDRIRKSTELSYREIRPISRLSLGNLKSAYPPEIPQISRYRAPHRKRLEGFFLKILICACIAMSIALLAVNYEQAKEYIKSFQTQRPETIQVSPSKNIHPPAEIPTNQLSI